MNKLTLTISILIIAVVYTLPAKAQLDVKLKKSNNVKVSTHELNGLQVIFTLDTTQKRTENGIKFSIKIKNDSTSDILVKNPLYFLTMSLTDEKGINILIDPIPKTTSNAAGPYSFRSFIIEKMFSKDKLLPSVDMANTDLVTIPKKGILEVVLRIPTVLNEKNNKEIMLGKGRYRLFALLRLVSPASNNVLQNNIKFSFPGTYINYGKQN